MTEQYLYLTTTGRVTGRPHEIEIWFVEYEGRYYVVSGGRYESDWVKNLQANPHVTFRVAGQQFHGTARPVEDTPELVQAVAQLMQAKYNWSDGLIVELAPEP